MPYAHNNEIRFFLYYVYIRTDDGNLCENKRSCGGLIDVFDVLNNETPVKRDNFVLRPNPNATLLIFTLSIFGMTYLQSSRHLIEQS